MNTISAASRVGTEQERHGRDEQEEVDDGDGNVALEDPEQTPAGVVRVARLLGRIPLFENTGVEPRLRARSPAERDDGECDAEQREGRRRDRLEPEPFLRTVG